MKTYLVDYIGVHCGMHYYLDAFKGVLESSSANEIEILSNYRTNDVPFFRHQYKGGIISKIRSLLINYYRLYKFITNHPNDLFIYLTYGNLIDVVFLYIISKAKYHIVDIHEAIAQYIDNKVWLKKLLARIYRVRISAVITHSQRTENFLDEWHYEGNRLYVPHFRYCFSKEFSDENVGDDIKASLQKNKINLLFFGNITYAKGIDILLTSINNLDVKEINNLNIIVAGKDADGTFTTVDLKYPEITQFILRHITDDELVFLYQNIDYVAMPYRKTSQSGILEMAFYFKKPIVATRIPYFERMLCEFKSFGILAEGADVSTYTNAVKQALSMKYEDYFSDSEYSIYENRKEIIEFIKEFDKYVAIMKDNI